MNLFNTLLSIAFFFLNQFVSAQNFNYLPEKADDQIQHYLEFSLSYNEQHEQPNWVAYELTKNEIYLPSFDRKKYSRFIEDHSITTGSAVHNDYTNTGYDRGHMSRAMYNKASEHAYKESFFMSNVSPQIGVKFNRVGGDWYKLEELEIAFAKSLGSIYGITGPVFKENLGVIGKSTKITIPGYFYKVILSKDKQHAIAFLLKHDNLPNASLWESAVSIDEIESLTGIDFFPALEDNNENKLESLVDLNYWKGKGKK